MIGFIEKRYCGPKNLEPISLSGATKTQNFFIFQQSLKGPEVEFSLLKEMMVCGLRPNIQNTAKDFCSSLFKSNSSTNSQVQEITSKSYLLLSNESKDFLSIEFSNEEIKRVVFQMGKLKAPGPDGFQAGFFQEYWDIVGEDVIEAVKNFFSNNSSISSLN